MTRRAVADTATLEIVAVPREGGGFQSFLANPEALPWPYRQWIADEGMTLRAVGYDDDDLVSSWLQIAADTVGMPDADIHIIYLGG